MSKIRFSAGRIDKFTCEPGKPQTFLWDSEAPGLGLRATANGAKAYIFQGKLNGNTVRITIGDPKAWSIDAAQTEARRLKILFDKGKDPRELKVQETAKAKAESDARLAKEKRDTMTLGKAWPAYIKSRRKFWSEWHIRDHENVARIGGVPKKRGKGLTEPGPLASLLDEKLTELTGDRIGNWLADEKKARPTQAALAFRLLSVFANWCKSQPEYAGLVPEGAFQSQQVRDELPAKKTKDGDSLQKEQLSAWFKAVRKMPNVVQSAYLQTLLLIGARRRELGALRWVDVDFQWRSITIRDKVEGERTIPLTPYVSSLLSALPRRNEWVFSSPTSKSGQLAEPTPGHKRALIDAGLPDISLHGLRRSFGTLCEWVEMPSGISAQIMGHKPSAIAEKHYRRRPLDLLRNWHDKIETWILAQAGVKFEPAQEGLRVVK